MQNRPSDRLTYGEHPDQYVDLFRTPSATDQGIIVLVHGGYWRTEFTAELMDPLVSFFQNKGMQVANIEYRRGPEHAWPIPLNDVFAATTTLKEHTTGPFCGIGHSVGGQLVMLAEKAFDSIVALAPVTDAARVYAEKLGDSAAQEYFQQSPEQIPGTYASASAVHQPGIRASTLIVHGNDDDRVPLRHSLDYAAAQWAADAPVDTLFLATLGHKECIQPEHSAWNYINQWMNTTVPSQN